MADLTATEVYRSLKASKLAGIVPTWLQFNAGFEPFCFRDNRFWDSNDFTSGMLDDAALAILCDAMWRASQTTDPDIGDVYLEDGKWWSTRGAFVHVDHGSDCAAALLHALGVEVVR